METSNLGSTGSPPPEEGHVSKRSAERRVNTLRYSIFGFLLLLVLGVVGYGLLYSTGAGDGSIVEGRDYELVDDAPPAGRLPIRVTEFFSYGCVHCRNFDPLIEDWLARTEDDVRFERAPMSFSPVWALLAQTYLTLELEDALAQNHDRLFRAVHDQQRQFLSAEQLADFVDGRGITRQRFLNTFNSSRVKRRLNEIDALAKAVEVRSVPTLSVAGRYRVGMDGGRKRALEIVDHLVALERAATAP